MRPSVRFLVLCRLLFAAGISTSSATVAGQYIFGNYCQSPSEVLQKYINKNVKNHVDILNISSDERYCAQSDEENLQMSRVYYRSRYGDMPVITIRNKKSKVLMINIFITGGPRSEAAEMLRNSVYKKRIILNLSKGSIWVFPSYFSTKERSLYPNADIYYASLELTSYIKFMKLKYPKARIRIVGLSLGGYISALISDDTPEDSIFLISPVMTSINDLESFFVKKYGTDLGVLPQMRLFEIPGSRETVGFRDVDQLEYIQKMRAGLPNKNIFQLLKSRYAKCVDIVYGEKDDRIGTQLANSARNSHPWIRFRVKKDHYHFWNSPSDVNYLFDLLDHQDCLNRGFDTRNLSVAKTK